MSSKSVNISALTHAHFGQFISGIARLAVTGKASLSITALASAAHVIHDLALVYVHARVIL